MRLASYIPSIGFEVHGTGHCMLNNKVEMKSTGCGARGHTKLTGKGT